MRPLPQISRWVVGVCLLLNVVALPLLAQRKSDSANTSSRLATIESLADYGTFFIDQSRYAHTFDKVQLSGRFLSSKPPVLPAIGAALYKAFSMATGVTFRNDEQRAILFVSLSLGVAPYIVLLIYFYRLLLVWVKDPVAIAWGFAAFSINNIGFGYATGLNNHTPAAAALLVAFYYAFLVRSGRSTAWRHWVLAGLFAGLAPTLEPWAAFFSVALTIYLATADLRRTLTVFIPSSLPFMLLHVSLTYAATGSIVPIYLRSKLYIYPGSFWSPLTDTSLSPEEVARRMGLEGIRDPRPLRYFHYTFGHHGLIVMTPVFLLSFWSMFSAIRRRGGRFAEALTVLAPTVVAIGFLGWRTINYGGTCFGFRWMLFAMPLLFLFAAAWAEEHPAPRARILFAVLVAAGILNALDSARGPWRFSTWHRMFRSFHEGRQAQGGTGSG